MDAVQKNHELTEREEQVLAFVRHCFKNHIYPVTLDLMAQHIAGLTKGTCSIANVQRFVESLEAKGLISREGGYGSAKPVEHR